MSQENVAVIRRVHEHFDKTGMPPWDVLDGEIEVHDHDIPDAGTYRGHPGFAQWLTDWGESWESFEMELERLVDAGDRVVSLFRLRATGRGSGATVERSDAMVSTIRDGMITRLDYFNDQSRALEAAGLQE